MHVVRFKHDEGQKLLHLWRKDRTGNKIVLFCDFIHFNDESIHLESLLLFLKKNNNMKNLF